MPSTPFRPLPNRSGQDPGRRRRPAGRVIPGLEALEPRSLMAGPGVAGNPPAVDRSADIDPPQAFKSGPAGDINPDGATTQTSYVVVSETEAPHGTLATAQRLPDDPLFGVLGTLGPTETIDLYRIAIGPGTLALRFLLMPEQTTAASPLRLSLFDAAGRLLGEWTSADGPDAQPPSLMLTNPISNSTLYVAITAGGPHDPGGAAPAIDYQLWVARQEAPGPLQIAGSGTGAVPSPPSVIIPLGPANGLPPGTTADVSGGSGPDRPGRGPDTRQGTGGPLPTLSAAPTAGMLTDRQPPLQAAAPVITMVVFDWPDHHQLEGSTPGPPARDGRPDEADPTAGRPDGMVIRSPGGFPLLGADPIGDWRRDPSAAPVLWAGARAPDGEGVSPVGVAAPTESPTKDRRAPIQPDLGVGLRLSLTIALACSAMTSGPAVILDRFAHRWMMADRGGRPDREPA